MRQSDAEAAAAHIFLWLAGDLELTARFLDAAGLAPADVGALAGQPEFLAAVVDFVLQEDASVIAAAGAAGIAPQDVAAVRAALPGGASWHWT